MLVGDEDFIMYWGTPEELAAPCTNPECRHTKAAHRHCPTYGLVGECIAADCQCPGWQG